MFRIENAPYTTPFDFLFVISICIPMWGTTRTATFKPTDNHFNPRSRVGNDVAGPEESYRYWVKTFNSSITDVYIDSENPTEVLIEFIMNDGELPNESIIRSLQDYLYNENIRPLTDKVIVKAPDTVEYALDLKYYINKSDSAQANTIQSAVNAAVENYIIWQRSKIGRDINPSKLICMLEDAGAKRVEINAPVFRKIEKTAVAKVTTKKVAYGGIEDD